MPIKGARLLDIRVEEAAGTLSAATPEAVGSGRVRI